MQRQYRVQRIGRKNLQQLIAVLQIGDITNFHIKGITQPRGKNERGELYYEVMKNPYKTKV